MTETHENPVKYILPYSRIVGQAQAKLALELAYISHQRIGGVLLSGERGTAKSTLVRAFARMMYDKLPVTLPINATEDRVLGGWKIDALMASRAVPQDGLLKQADGSLLYVDEVNLLDDYLVNLILDTTAMGVVEVQREGREESQRSQFVLVGTMNPEEGGLRPQLLDRFGLMVAVTTAADTKTRQAILRQVLAWDERVADAENQRQSPPEDAEDQEIKQKLEAAKSRFFKVNTEKLIAPCIALAAAFQATGHRGELTMLQAARAHAAREQRKNATLEDLRAVAPMALQHRRAAQAGEHTHWSEADQAELERLTNAA